MRARGIVLTVTWVLAAGSCLSSSPASAHPARACPSWSLVPANHFEGGLTSVLALSPTNVWAGGLSGEVNPPPLIAHYDGSSWKSVDVGVDGVGGVEALAGSKPSNIWAAGSVQYPDVTGPVGLLLHYDGQTWHSIRPPHETPIVRLLAVAIFDGSVWVAGVGGDTTFVARRTASGWVNTNAPDAGAYVSLSVSGNGLWAAGRSTDQQPFAAFWNGKRWLKRPGAPSTSIAVLGDVVPISGRDVWGFGLDNAQGLHSNSLIEHWDGQAWSVVPNPMAHSDSALGGGVAISSTDVWAIGRRIGPDPNPSSQGTPLYEHWNGEQWKRVANSSASPTGGRLDDIASSPQGRLWAVGSGAPGNHPLVATLPPC